MLVQPAVASIAGIQAQYLAQLPKDDELPGWTYRVISNKPNYTLTSKRPGLTFRRIQIDVYGAAAADVITLAAAIDQVLSGYSGTLSDSDSTKVDSCFQSDLGDPQFDEARRTWRRFIEYTVNFMQV
jgi:hypothetical protein